MPALVEMGELARHEGASPLLFQHLFWFFGHPEVYIVALPAFGIVSDLISVHARRNIFGYRMMVWAIVIIGALNFVVWAHHMYVSGMNPWFGFFFATTTLIIAVPTAIKVYNWRLTLWRGDIHLTVPMLAAGSLALHGAQRAAGEGRGGRMLAALGAAWLLALLFLAGQTLAWRTMMTGGMAMTTNPAASFFYLRTGAPVRCCRAQ